MREAQAPLRLLPTEESFQRRLALRRAYNRAWRYMFLASIAVGLIALTMLFYNIVRQTFTLVAIENTVDPASLSDRPLAESSAESLLDILTAHVSFNRRRVLVLQDVAAAPQADWPTLNQSPLRDFLDDAQYPGIDGETLFMELSEEQVNAILLAGLSRDALEIAVLDEVVKPRVIDSWMLVDGLLHREEIEAEVYAEQPNAEIRWRSWISLDFLTNSMHSRPELSGLRTAILGSLWMMLITAAIAFPLGIGAALYLEEYAADTWLNRIIQLNITNLAGVPSIIYGILGLVVFVRLLEMLTSGKLLGLTEGGTVSGRTILSASLTMALLILPIIIISAQEAIRAVPSSQRQASYGMGATKLQMIRTVVLPNAMPGILTGTILAISRAFGETAPLVVVGSITRITVDPSSPFSRFTAIPIQIYSWTSQPSDEFRSIAAAAIVVLLAILLLFNSTAIILRNRYSKRW